MSSIRAVVVVFVLAVCAPSAHGAEAVMTLIAPSETVRPGTSVRIDIVGLNANYDSSVAFEAKPSLPATLETAAIEFPVTLIAISEKPSSIDARGFAVRSYTVQIPDEADGNATLIVHAGARRLATALMIARDTAGRPPIDALERTSSAIEAFPRALPGRLSIYFPSYFIYGGTTRAPAAKYQFSLKYRALTIGGATADHPRPSLQFAYTQRSLWDTKAPSEPFYDTSYMPEVFVESVHPRDERDRRVSIIGWACGIRHESNGKDGLDSRGYNMVYARLHMSAGSPQHWYIAAAPEIWSYVFSHDEMPKVEKYRGNARLYLVGGHGTGASVVYIATANKKLEALSHEVNLFIPVGVRPLDFATYVLVQYFDGYAESLRAFTARSHSVRVGLSLIR